MRLLVGLARFGDRRQRPSTSRSSAPAPVYSRSLLATMPELPEVEHTRRNLDTWLRGARLTEVTAHDPRVIRPAKPAAFSEALTGKKVATVERKGKWLRLLLDDDTRLFVHLGMTGWFEHSSGVDSSNPHRSANGDLVRFERVRFEVVRPRRTKSEVVSYVDPRRWGQLVLATEDIPSWTSLGPDPLADGVDLEVLEKRLARRKKQSIKEALMDQTVLAGVGNIQAIESLWKAKIDPRSGASAVAGEPKLLAKIARAIGWTIARTLEDLAKGEAGAKNPFKVYGRKGEPCPRCRTALERFDLGGRTTTVCPTCQRLVE